MPVNPEQATHHNTINSPENTTTAACCAPNNEQAPMPPAAAEALALRFKALSDPNRLRIISILSAQPETETCVCDLPEPLGLGQPTVSHHLKILVNAGLLNREKRGVWAYYSLVPGALDALADTLRQKTPAV